MYYHLPKKEEVGGRESHKFPSAVVMHINEETYCAFR